MSSLIASRSRFFGRSWYLRTARFSKARRFGHMARYTSRRYSRGSGMHMFVTK